MSGLLLRVRAFLLRDWRIGASYPLAMLLGTGGIFFSVLIWFFFSRMMSGFAIPALGRYGQGSDYFAFVIVGLALQNYLSVAMGGLTRSIREGQMLGTLEMLLVTPTSLPVVIFASSVGPFLATTLRIAVYFAFGALYGLSFEVADPGALLLVLALSILAFSTFGIVSAAVILVVKRGDPFAVLVGIFSTLLSGIYYPVEVLPRFFQDVAWFVPVTHAAEALRLLLLAGKSLADVRAQVLWLALFSLGALPLALWAFSIGVRRARLHGTLGHF